jgi:hypothetical protein
MQHLTRDQQEIEWQFDALDVRPVGRWLENGVGEDPAIVPGETREISDTYLDTEDWRIYQAATLCESGGRKARTERKPR